MVEDELREQQCGRHGDEQEAVREELRGAGRPHLLACVSAAERVREQRAGAGAHASHSRCALGACLEVEHCANQVQKLAHFPASQ